MPFTQNYFGSIGTNVNIENLNGTLTINGREVLTVNSRPEDLAKQLADVRKALEASADVDPKTKAEVIADVKAAEQEAKSDKPKGDAVKGHLDKAAETLKKATDTASNAFSLAKVLFEVGKWAVAIFV